MDRRPKTKCAVAGRGGKMKEGPPTGAALGYVTLTPLISRAPHFVHSKVKRSRRVFSLSMPNRRNSSLHFGQVSRDFTTISRWRAANHDVLRGLQAGAPSVSQPPTPGTKPQPVTA